MDNAMDEAYTLTELSPMRKVIAARMSDAKRTIPHFRVTADIEMDALVKLRRDLQQAGHEVSLNDLLVKACALALVEVPSVNVQWAEDGIHQFRTADISIVTAVAGGLSTPIIRNADSKSVLQIASELRELVQRAGRNALKLHEIQGGSFSISNLGMYGVDQFDAIVNPPQCAILAIGSAKPQAVVGADGQIRVASVLRATLSVDHRAIDGVAAATFLGVLRRHVQRSEPLAS